MTRKLRNVGKYTLSCLVACFGIKDGQSGTMRPQKNESKIIYESVVYHFKRQ